ncbi:hypothetical protein MUP05_11460 [Candidatus Bathyarchaeota archaeon]|nr:hypothetical protein [Candidatus Bathyarchaeota archaeon]
MEKKICKCGANLNWIQQYDRFYCSNCREYPPQCPTCKKDLFWVTDYQHYYCDTCMKYQIQVKPAETTFSRSRTYSPEQIQKIFSDLKERKGARMIDDLILAKLSRGLKFRDANGRVWAIGLESGKWYCFENERWVEGKPPESLMP